jgi:hypothetical protein
MDPKTDASAGLPRLSPEQLDPYLSMTVLECTESTPAAAFRALTRFLDEAAQQRGRAVSCQPLTADTFDAHAVIPGMGRLEDFGFDELHVGTRQLVRQPSWASRQADLLDVVHELTLAVRWQHLVAVAGDSPSGAKLLRWVDAHPALYRPVPYTALAGSFTGDHLGLWTRGIHQRRTTKQDSKTMTGLRLQDALSPREDGDYSVSAAVVDHEPADDKALIRNRVTLSPQRSRISWRATADFGTFLTGAREVLDAVAKVLAAGRPEWQFGPLPEPEEDVTKVRLAVDVSLETEDGADDTTDEEVLRCVEFLRSAELAVDGRDDAATARLRVTADDTTTELELTPVAARDGFRFEVRHVSGTPRPELREVEEHLRSGSLLRVLYGSGHACDGRTLFRRNIGTTPFANIEFGDFSGYSIGEEKPAGTNDQQIHRNIAEHGDTSLFAWVVDQCRSGWLLCDDGNGEVADFLHLTGDGQLTAIHVKASGSTSAGRQISLVPFEQLASQATKNKGLLEREPLVDRLRERLGDWRRPWSATWHDGARATAAGFLDALDRRRHDTRTHVRLVQPHLSETAHRRAKGHIVADRRTVQAYRLRLLDELLNDTRQSIISNCHDLTVVGCR